MRADKRKHPRKAMRYAAWVQDGDTNPQSCVLSDISDSGARIEVQNPDDVPELFTLLLSGQANSARRRCRVKWRTEDQIGVQFENRVVPAARSPR
jgi:hypothetical protein